MRAAHALALSIFSLLPGLAAAATPPASIALGPVAKQIAADGTTAIVATLKRSDGSLYTDGPVLVNFRSNCSATGTARLDASVTAVAGIASSVYQPDGCSGPDQITASVGTGLAAVRQTAIITVDSRRALSPKALLGKALFFDKALSASGQQACASCHAPANNYLAPGTGAVPLGGLSGTVVGFRSAPSAAYAALTPPFGFLTQTNKEGTANNGANGKLGTPRRGLMWDGRDSTVFTQAKGPFLAAHEMANASSAAVLAKLLTRPYMASFRAVYGNTTATSNPDTVLTQMAQAIGQFETEDASFKLFNSKFDAVEKGLASFTAQESRGRALFFDGHKGACAGCHQSNGQLQSKPGPQMFTDLSYRVLAVPRNWTLPYNIDASAESALKLINQTSLLNGSKLGSPNHAFYDLGFCGPFRTDALGDSGLCGAFRVPGLRNVALKGSYFHNGVFSQLSQVLNFYVNRDASPRSVYLKADGSPDLPYNDLPAIYHANREVRPPFTPSRSGPRLTPDDAKDLISFLCTLTDGYDPQQAAAYRLPAQCRAAVRP